MRNYRDLQVWTKHIRSRWIFTEFHALFHAKKCTVSRLSFGALLHPLEQILLKDAVVALAVNSLASFGLRWVLPVSLIIICS